MENILHKNQLLKYSNYESLNLPPFACPFISLIYRKFNSPKIDTHSTPSPRRAHLLFFMGRYILHKINANTHIHTLYLLIMYSVAVKIPRLFADIDVNSRRISLFEKNFYEKYLNDVIAMPQILEPRTASSVAIPSFLL